MCPCGMGGRVWAGCSAVRPKIGHDTPICRNFICPSPEDLAAHHRLSRKSPWPALSSSLLHDHRDINSEVMGTHFLLQSQPVEIWVPALSLCSRHYCSNPSYHQGLWRHANLTWKGCVLQSVMMAKRTARPTRAHASRRILDVKCGCHCPSH